MTGEAHPAPIREVVAEVLRRIAPELSPSELDPRRPLRDQVDLDSIDWLNFLVALRKRLGVDIPEVDYAKLISFDDVVAYLEARCRAGR